MTELFDRIFNMGFGSRSECDECDGEPPGVRENIQMRPITVILGREWRFCNSFAEFSMARLQEAGYTWLIQCPESVYHPQELVKHFVPGIIKGHIPTGICMITTMSVVVIETFKKYIEQGQLTDKNIVFIYADSKGGLSRLPFDKKGVWRNPYPDKLYSASEWQQWDYQPDEEEDDVDNSPPKKVKTPRTKKKGETPPPDDTEENKGNPVNV